MKILDGKLYVDGKDLVYIAGKQCNGNPESERCSKNYTECNAYELFNAIEPNFHADYPQSDLCPVISGGRPRLDARFKVSLDDHIEE